MIVLVVIVAACSSKREQTAAPNSPVTTPAPASCGYDFAEETDHDAVDIELAILRGAWIGEGLAAQRRGFHFDDGKSSFRDLRFLFKEEKFYKAMTATHFTGFRLSKPLEWEGNPGYRAISLSKEGACTTYVYSVSAKADTLFIFSGHSCTKPLPIARLLEQNPLPTQSRNKFHRYDYQP